MDSGQQGHGHNYSGTESDRRSQQTATRPLSPVEHGAGSEVVQHNSADNDRLMNTQTSGDLGNYVVSIPLEITSAAFPGVSNIFPANSSVRFAHMYNGQGVKGSDASPSRMANHSEQGCEPPHAAPATKWDGLGKSHPRPGTSIRTLLSPAPSEFSHNEDSGSTTSSGKDNDQASPRALADVKISYNRNPGASDAPPGKLVSAREQLRFLLRGSGRRRVHKSRSLFPPSP